MGNQTLRSATSTMAGAVGSEAGGLPRGSAASRCLRIGVLRIGEERRDRAGLDDLALGHDADAVGDLSDDAQIVGDEQHGHAEAAAAAP